MKSNYPRASDEAQSPAKPKIWLYSVGLGLVVYLVGYLYALTESSASFLGFTLRQLDADILFVPTLLVLAAGVLLLWKSSKWKIVDKAKLISLTTALIHVVAFTFFAGQRSPDYRTVLEQYGSLLVVTLYLAAMLTVACTVIWGLASLPRLKKSSHPLQMTVLRAREERVFEGDLKVTRQSGLSDDDSATVKS